MEDKKYLPTVNASMQDFEPGPTQLTGPFGTIQSAWKSRSDPEPSANLRLA